jgi:hypothetical protein
MVPPTTITLVASPPFISPFFAGSLLALPAVAAGVVEVLISSPLAPPLILALPLILPPPVILLVIPSRRLTKAIIVLGPATLLHPTLPLAIAVVAMPGTRTLVMEAVIMEARVHVAHAEADGGSPAVMPQLLRHHVLPAGDEALVVIGKTPPALWHIVITMVWLPALGMLTTMPLMPALEMTIPNAMSVHIRAMVTAPESAPIAPIIVVVVELFSKSDAADCWTFVVDPAVYCSIVCHFELNALDPHARY